MLRNLAKRQEEPLLILSILLSHTVLFWKSCVQSFNISFRWCCQQYCCSTSSSCFPTRRSYQEDQSWPSGKHVQTSKRSAQRPAEKDNCKPFAKEKTLLLDLVNKILPYQWIFKFSWNKLLFLNLAIFPPFIPLINLQLWPE